MATKAEAANQKIADAHVLVCKPESDLDYAILYVALNQDGLLSSYFHESIPGVLEFLSWVKSRYTLVAYHNGMPVGFGMLIGPITLKSRTGEWRKAEVSVAFVRKVSPAVVLSACRMMLKQAVKDLGIDMFWVTIPVGNRASRLLAKRIGFEQVAVLPKYTLWNGCISDSWVGCLEVKRWADRT